MTDDALDEGPPRAAQMTRRLRRREDRLRAEIRHRCIMCDQWPALCPFDTSDPRRAKQFICDTCRAVLGVPTAT